MEHVLRVEDLSWKRGESTVLSHVNWRIQKGEHWALIGLNGSGKTTLLNMINGYIWPTIGTVHVLGNRYGTVKVSEVRKSIGWVSSSLQEKLYGESLTEEVVISGKYASIGLYDDITEADTDKAIALMETMGCRHLIHRQYGTCSQGEKQKLLIIRALMADPELLILDEPCNGLDLFSREQLLQSVEELAKLPNGPTLIYVTHHLEEIMPVFTHTMLLRRGEVYASGQTVDVLTEERLSSFFEHPISIEHRSSVAAVQLRV